jgi:hypothetical protein
MEPFYFSPEALCNHSFKDKDNDIVDARFEARSGSFTFGVKRIPTTDEAFRRLLLLSDLRPLNSILQRRFAGGARAMNAAEDLSICFHAMPHDPAIAVWADWRQRVDRAFEAIECVMLSGYDHFERFVIFILANFACSHT